MAVKSILEIDVDDESFKKFKASFDEYTESLKKNQKVEADHAKKTQSWNQRYLSFFKDIKNTQNDHDRSLKNSEKTWEGIAKSAGSVSKSLFSATTSLIRWASLTSAVGGLLGAGGLFGMDRLGGGVVAGRRSSQGLGTAYGSQQAFGLNFGREVDAGSFLSSVNESLTDVTKRFQLNAAGLSENDIQGKDTAQVAAALLPKLKAIADQTPDQYMGQAVNARNIGGLVTVEDMRRLKAMSPEEMARQQAHFQKDAGTLGLSEDAQSKWQDFTSQMTRAGDTIENVFVKGLTGLTGPLTKLSESFVHAVEILMTNTPKMEKWLTQFGNGIEHLAEYMGTDKFEQNVKSFVDGVESIASAMIWLGKKVGGIVGSSETPTNTMSKAEQSAYDTHVDKMIKNSTENGWNLNFLYSDADREKVKNDIIKNNPLYHGGGSSGRANNFGNIRSSSGDFRSFDTPEQGVQAIARQLTIYEDRDKLDTISKIISKYAPPKNSKGEKENDTESYIRNVSKWSGIDANQPIDVHDPNVMAKIVSAIIRQEGGDKSGKYGAGAVVTIINNTGGNAIATVGQLPN